MYIYERTKLAEHSMFEQAVELSILQTKKVWSSIYRDPTGELAITFIGKLDKDQIKTVLMHFKDLIDGDTDVNNISCKEDLDYAYRTKTLANHKVVDTTEIYTPDGYDYSQF